MSSLDTDQKLGCIAIEGPDSARFLQGQCTADAAGLTVEQWSLAGFANVKGRLYANGRLARLGEDHFWFLLPQRNVAHTLAQLSKYAAFFKTTLTDVSAHWEDSAQPSLQGKPYALTQTANEVILHCPDEWQLVLSPQAIAYDAQQWAAYEMQQGLVWITPEIVAEFLPQELEWDRLGGVNYQKGCYTGQEVIARLHYRGQLKKGLRHLSGGSEGPKVLEKLNDSAGKARAQIARVEPHADGWEALAVVNHDTTELVWAGQTINLGAWIAPEME